MIDASNKPSVSVAIACYKHAHFLADAIESVLAQTSPAVEIVVVDDGSPDDTREVASRYPDVMYVRQENMGLAAARNTGIRSTSSPFLVFLDADDRLLPNALEAGLKAFHAHPACAFVSGGFRYIDSEGTATGDPVIPHVVNNHYIEMLRCSYIAMHATVMFRREILDRVGGFDNTLRVCEDFDLYLRIVREHPVSCHGAVVAEYRRHGSNVSSHSAKMLKTALRVLRSQWPYVKSHVRYREAYFAGLRFWKSYYGLELVQQIKQAARTNRPRRALDASMALLRLAPGLAGRRTVRSIGWRSRSAARRARTLLPEQIVRHLQRLRVFRPDPPPPGQVDMGDLQRVTPVSRRFGFDRGLPIDRYYIEGFLFRHADDIAGDVLEIADNDYTVRFGGAAVRHSDVLHVNHDNPKATLVGDLAEAPHLPDNGFDCIILTQTLHLIFDTNAALRTLHRILKPGGVLLMTVPGITQVEHGVRGNQWFWTFTDASVRLMLEALFPPSAVDVETHGNVFAAVSFLHGLALHEVSTAALDYRDPAYQVIVAARAVKPCQSA